MTDFKSDWALMLLLKANSTILSCLNSLGVGVGEWGNGLTLSVELPLEPFTRVEEKEAESEVLIANVINCVIKSPLKVL